MQDWAFFAAEHTKLNTNTTKESYKDNARVKDRKSTSKNHTKNVAVHFVVWLLLISCSLVYIIFGYKQ